MRKALIVRNRAGWPKSLAAGIDFQYLFVARIVLGGRRYELGDAKFEQKFGAVRIRIELEQGILDFGLHVIRHTRCSADALAGKLARGFHRGEIRVLIPEPG